MIVEVLPGQFIYGKYSASKELKMNASTIWKRMQKLKTLGNCNLESNHHYTLVTIINWLIYQHEKKNSNYESNHQVTTIKPPSKPYNKDNKEKKVNKEKKSIFIRPSLEEIYQYCQVRKNSIDPEAWLSHYESNGWMVGKNKMQNWKAAIITWEKRNGGQHGSGTRTSSSTGTVINQKGRAKSDGQPWPIDYEF